MDKIAIVGASLAGIQAARAFRRADFNGEITVIGDEPHYPYDRPPLSKEYLTGDFDEAKLRLRPAVDPDELGVVWRLGCRAAGLTLRESGGAELELELDDGGLVRSDGVVIATGARPRTLPGTDGIGGVHLLRSLDDARAIKADLEAGPERVVVIGCGFIGAEVAASARERGLEVTIVEAADAPLGRVLDEASGMAVADLHRGHGVDVKLGTGVGRIVDEDDRVRAVELTDGEVIETSVVVIGIGVVPNTDWLTSSDLTIDDGVVTDENCVAAPGVVAVGDVARWANRRFGGRLTRVEQWDNAVEMGDYGAKQLLGIADGPFQPVPWFWSDQYDRKIQLAGVASTNVEIVQGSIAEQRFVQLYSDDAEQVTGVLCWNRPRQAILGRQHIAAGMPLGEMRDALS